jgi:hypothetical protein
MDLPNQGYNKDKGKLQRGGLHEKASAVLERNFAAGVRMAACAGQKKAVRGSYLKGKRGKQGRSFLCKARKF